MSVELKILSARLKPPWNHTHLHPASGACGFTVLLEDTFTPNDTLAVTEIQPMTLQLDSLLSRCRATLQRYFIQCQRHKSSKIFSNLIQYFLMGWNKFLTQEGREERSILERSKCKGVWRMTHKLLVSLGWQQQSVRQLTGIHSVSYLNIHQAEEEHLIKEMWAAVINLLYPAALSW